MIGRTIPGSGLARMPHGSLERKVREERRKQIKQARRQAETIVEGGRKWKLVRLPDAYASDYPVHDEQSDAA
jgi:hypothetical protein